MNLDHNKIEQFFKGELKTDITSICKLGGGRNSRVYKVTSDINIIYCVKFYFTSNVDSKDRLFIESTAFSNLRKCGFHSIPNVIAVDRKMNMAVYSYIEGYKYETHEYFNIAKVVDFIISLQDEKVHNIFLSFADAADASFSLNEIFADIERRFDRLSNHKSINSTAFSNFYFNELLPFYGEEKDAAIERSTNYGIDSATLLDDHLKILSPSDFGLHNIIISGDGRLNYIDFEYFGWDTPEKCINDFLLHPGFTLPYSTRMKFKELLCYSLQNDKDVLFRTNNTYKLYGIKWCLIILNVFSENDLNRRMFSDSSDQEVVLIKRLSKAKEFLATLKLRTYYDSK